VKNTESMIFEGIMLSIEEDECYRYYPRAMQEEEE